MGTWASWDPFKGEAAQRGQAAGSGPHSLGVGVTMGCADAGSLSFHSIELGPGLTMGLPLPAGQGWAAGPLRASFWRRLGVIDRSLGNTIRLPRLGRAARQGRWEKHKASCKRLPWAQGRGRGWG